jgi:hypothetical protein
MKIAKLLILIVFHLSFYANAQSVVVSNKHLNDSLNLKATKLKRLYMLSTSSSKDVSNIYKQQFFDAFPNTFQQLDELYGDHLDAHHKPAPLNDQAEQHIVDLFNKLNTINDTLYYRKIISISIGGHWDGDAVNFFQEGLRNKVLKDPAIVVDILKHISNARIQSFWYFYFDEPYPEKKLPEPLQKVKSIDIGIYNLMIKAHNDALKQNK